MDDHTLLALEADIAHWDALAHVWRPSDYKIERGNMALCREFYYHQDCEGCPMLEKFSRSCGGTMYRGAVSIKEVWLERNAAGKDEGNVRVSAQRYARLYGEELRSVHNDNREVPPPPGVLDSLEAVIEVATHGERVAVLFNQPVNTPLARGLLIEIKERYSNEVDSKRRIGVISFKSGGQLVLLHKPQQWEGQEFAALFVHSKAPEVLPFELKDLYARIR